MAGGAPVLVVERGHAGDKLKDEDTERPPVGSTVVALLQDDLRCEVLWCAAKRVCLAAWGHFLGKAKISDLEVALGVDQQVLWLQVTAPAASLLQTE